MSATLTVTASAHRVFAVLADPTTHAAIDGRSRATDGTGRVVEAVDQARLTKVGQIFRMGMNHPDHPEGDYRTFNKVHVLDPPRAIGWLTGHAPAGDGQLEFGGWFWRYDLVPVSPSQTEVTLTYDWTAVPQSVHDYLRFPPIGPERLADSLHHLATLAAPESRA
ncbi:ATPase [Ruania suaedae]|uniref:ATPase n=1 Tax=Ruania suaedae TaxID=2897774 RepID=UPI001E5B9036|nr:ATPase [Ruania suaedae]UFU04365.1 ATPase [Ruania suaedae]